MKKKRVHASTVLELCDASHPRERTTDREI